MADAILYFLYTGLWSLWGQISREECDNGQSMLSEIYVKDLVCAVSLMIPQRVLQEIPWYAASAQRGACLTHDTATVLSVIGNFKNAQVTPAGSSVASIGRPSAQ